MGVNAGFVQSLKVRPIPQIAHIYSRAKTFQATCKVGQLSFSPASLKRGD